MSNKRLQTTTPSVHTRGPTPRYLPCGCVPMHIPTAMVVDHVRYGVFTAGTLRLVVRNVTPCDPRPATRVTLSSTALSNPMKQGHKSKDNYPSRMKLQKHTNSQSKFHDFANCPRRLIPEDLSQSRVITRDIQINSKEAATLATSQDGCDIVASRTELFGRPPIPAKS